jgi:hypothetical protein
MNYRYAAGEGNGIGARGGTVSGLVSGFFADSNGIADAGTNFTDQAPRASKWVRFAKVIGSRV